MPDPTAPEERARTAAREIRVRTGVESHDVAVVLGSGWVAAADVLGEATADLPVGELTGFLPPSVAGHAGRVRSVPVGGRRVLVLLGRTHLYEGHGVAQVVHGVRTAAAAGARTIVLTNAAGGVHPDLHPGQPVLVRDHLNLTGHSPLIGAQFVDLTDLYSSRLRALAHEVDGSLAEGVYAGLPGPHYETPAEVAMLARLGADLVGMSTVLEAIAARAVGCEVLAVSLVTNFAAGVSPLPLDHGDVLAAGSAAAGQLGGLLRGVVGRL